MRLAPIRIRSDRPPACAAGHDGRSLTSSLRERGDSRPPSRRDASSLVSRFGWLAGLLSRELHHIQTSIRKEPPVKRTIPITFLLVAWQPLLVGSGILTKRTIKCAGGAYASTVHASSLFGPPWDMPLTVRRWV
jgi:hypothetical protein